MAEDQYHDPIAVIANLGRNLGLADHLGDIYGNIERAWKLVGLGPLPTAEGGEVIDEDDPERTYDCGEIMCGEVTRLHGVDGLWRETRYSVILSWVDDYGERYATEHDVDADSPMDAARVAYHKECDERSVVSLGYVDATVGDDRFEIEPRTCVRVRVLLESLAESLGREDWS